MKINVGKQKKNNNNNNRINKQNDIKTTKTMKVENTK